MTNVATQVMAVVNAPYGANLSAHQLAMKITDPSTVFDASVFAFFSDVSLALQSEFMDVMDVDKQAASKVASLLAEVSGYEISKAA